MEKISKILIEYQGTEEQKEILKDVDLLVALILDCTTINLKASETQKGISLQRIVLCTAL